MAHIYIASMPCGGYSPQLSLIWSTVLLPPIPESGQVSAILGPPQDLMQHRAQARSGELKFNVEVDGQLEVPNTLGTILLLKV